MAEDINWTAYGLVEEALESALLGHSIPWEEVRAAALKAVDFIGERMRIPEGTEQRVTAAAPYIPKIVFQTPTLNTIELSGALPGVP